MKKTKEWIIFVIVFGLAVYLLHDFLTGGWTFKAIFPREYGIYKR